MRAPLFVMLGHPLDDWMLWRWRCTVFDKKFVTLLGQTCEAQKSAWVLNLLDSSWDLCSHALFSFVWTEHTMSGSFASSTESSCHSQTLRTSCQREHLCSYTDAKTLLRCFFWINYLLQKCVPIWCDPGYCSMPVSPQHLSISEKQNSTGTSTASTSYNCNYRLYLMYI